MRRLAEVASARRHRIGRWLVFSRVEWSTPAALVESARRILGPIDERIPLVAGTLANFLELNRARLPWDQLDGVCFSAHPQEHASDDASLVENLEGLASAIETARCWPWGARSRSARSPCEKRVNPYATGPAARAGLRASSPRAWTRARCRSSAPPGRSGRSSTWPSSGPRGRPSTRPPAGSA